MIDETLAGYEETAPSEPDDDNEAGAAQVAPVSVPEIKSLLGLAVAAVVVASLYLARDVLVPITLAIILAFILSPVVSFLQLRRLWRAPAVILTVLAALGIIAMVGTLMASQAGNLAASAPRYATALSAKVESAQGFAKSRLEFIIKGIGMVKPVAAVAAPALGTRETGSAVPRRPVLVELDSEQSSPATVARTILAPIIGPLETMVIVVIVAIFMLIQREDLRDRFIRLFGSSDLHRTTLALDDAGRRLSRYLLSQLAVNTGFGLVIGIGLWAIGIPSPALWGVLAGLLRFVPYIGSLIAALAPMALGAAIDPGWSMAVYVALLFLTIEPLVGYALEPMLYGHSTGLSPISVVVAAIFWTWIWGPIGLILSTPLSLCLVVLGRNVRSLEFFDVLLGDRPALSAVESFYQRILANDPDEAIAQAEGLIAEHSLLGYYDGVAIAGLKLAATDAARGPVDSMAAAKVARAMLAVVRDLGEYIPVPVAREGGSEAAPAPEGRVIACVAGPAPFDAAVAAMVDQLLRQRGASPRRLSSAAVSRETMASLELADVAVVVLCNLELSGTPARLRYLIKRLRARAPAARIVVGLWDEDEPVIREETLQRALGADRYAASLRDIVDMSLERAVAAKSSEIAA